MDNSYDDIYRRICRVCLSQSENTVSLIDDSSKNGLSCFGVSIAAITNVFLRKGDKLPSQMCQNCVYLLKQAISFKLKCEMSDSKLKQLVKEVMSKHWSDQDIKEIVCQYIMFNSYFPPTSDLELHDDQLNIECNKSLQYMGTAINFKMNSETFVGDAVYDYDNFLHSGEMLNKIDDVNTDLQNDGEDDIDIVLNAINDLINADTIVVKKKKHQRKRKKYKSVNNIDSEDSTGISIETKEKNSTAIQNLNPISSKDKNKRPRRRMKKGQKFFCKICNKIFAYHSSHRLHMRRHENGENLEGKPRKCKVKTEQRYMCKICNRLLSSGASYTVHMRRHNNFLYICDQCGKGFAVPNEMRMHQVSKHGIGPCLQCDYCSFKTTIKSYLVEHVRLHTGERPFTCEHCGLTFRRRAIWKKHLIRHMEKKFQCTYCPLKFYSNFQLSEHCNSVHNRKYMYICNICSATYIQTKMVRRHMAVEHGMPRDMQGKIAKVSVGHDELPE